MKSSGRDNSVLNSSVSVVHFAKHMYLSMGES